MGLQAREASHRCLGAADAVEVERLVNGAGLVALGNRQLSVGLPLAGRRVTLHVEATVVHMLADGR